MNEFKLSFNQAVEDPQIIIEMMLHIKSAINERMKPPNQE